MSRTVSISMSKATVTRLFVAAGLAVAAGTVLGFANVLAAVTGGVVTFGGPQIVTVNAAAFAGTLVWLAVASLMIGAGALAALASWIAALLNTAQLEDRTWFVALLVLGLFSLGWIAVVAYVLAGPDGTRPRDAASAVAAEVVL